MTNSHDSSPPVTVIGAAGSGRADPVSSGTPAFFGAADARPAHRLSEHRTKIWHRV